MDLVPLGEDDFLLPGTSCFTFKWSPGPNKIILTLDDITFLHPHGGNSRKVGEVGSQEPAVLSLPGPALTPAPLPRKACFLPLLSQV